MAKQDSNIADQRKTAPKTDVQWNIMMVGNHGRVIPLRRFLPMVVVAGILVVLGLAALVTLVILFTRQNGQMRDMQSRMQEINKQAEALRDQRDVYLAKMVILQEELDKIKGPVREATEPGETTDAQNDESNSAKDAPAAKSDTTAAAAKTVDEPAISLKMPPIAWGATIKNFTATYDPGQKHIRLQFRVYNTSTPKKQLSGRCVAVLKNRDDPPIKWVALPAVLLTDGKPESSTGFAFRINNYRTITLTAVNQQAPVEFDTASIYVFEANGTQLYQEDHRFSIDYVPPPKPVPAPKPSEPPAAISDHIDISPKAPVVTPPAGVQNQPAPQPAMEASESKPAASDTADGLMLPETSGPREAPAASDLSNPPEPTSTPVEGDTP